ncbi:MAG: glycoside hydrolase [Gammaproteobacteria bacterium]|nr:glycoside hydrolase [Gammaproteobacteria bacterium]MDH5801825.1 glycoside hydrolase [Gammaproteobacteria bacterium]
MQRTKIFNALLILSLGTLVSACGGGSLSKSSSLSSDEGLVLIKVMSNSVLNDPDFPYWHTLTIKKADSKPARLITLQPNENLQGYANTLTFARSLPAGKYVLSTLSASSKSNPNNLEVKKLGLSFQVKPGQFTNVGNLIYQPQGNLLTRKTFSMGLDTDDDGAKALVEKHFPEIAKQVLAQPLVHIASSENRDRRLRDVARHAKANSAVLNNPVFTAKGHFYSGARFGQVLRKEFDWESLDTGYNQEISTVLPLQDGTLVAGGEDGLLIMSNDKGRTWKPVPAPDNNSWVFYSAQNNKKEIFVASVNEGVATVYKTESLDSPNWNKLKSFSVNSKRLHESLPKMKLTTEHLIVVADDDVYTYDFGSGGWNSRDMPFEAKDIAQQVNILDDGTIVAYETDGKMNRVYKTSNQGKDWEKQGAIMHISSLVFIDGQTGYSLNPKPGEVGKRIVLHTSDGGKTWTKASDAPDLVSPRLLADAYNQMLYMVGASGKVFMSTDFGNSWNPVRNVAWYE